MDISEIAQNFLPPEKQIFKQPQFKKADFEKLFNRVTPCKYLPEYDQVLNWIHNNEGKGLALIGANGRGKTIIGKYIIPVLFIQYHAKIFTTVDAHEMNARLDELLKKKFLSIDDLGTEGQRIVFGEKRWALPEILDKAEKNRNILLLTSNLDADAFEQKYGKRTRERIRAVCKVAVFSGESLRE